MPRNFMPAYFGKLAEFFIVPLMVLSIAYIVSGQFRLKYSAGVDFFILYLSADLAAAMDYESSRAWINPLFRDQFLPVFLTLICLCFLLILAAGKTQNRIDDYRDYKLKAGTWNSSWPVPAPPVKKYPLTGVVVCWIFTIALLPAHLFLYFGKAT